MSNRTHSLIMAMSKACMLSVFVTLEGPEGAGKSSVMRGLAHLLESDDIKVLTTR